MYIRKRKLLKSPGRGFGERASIYTKSRDFPWAFHWPLPHHTGEPHVASALSVALLHGCPEALDELYPWNAQNEVSRGPHRLATQHMDETHSRM